MITAQHLISDIRNIITSGGNSDDVKVSNEQILYWINEVRSMLIAQALGKRDNISDAWVQTIGCLEMELVDKSECCDVETNCMVLKSVQQIPRTVETDTANMIVGVYTIEGELIDEVSNQSSRYSKYNKFTKSKTGWYISNDYLYIINNTLLSMVSIAGIWEDPSDLEEFATCEGTPCWSTDSEYPISLRMAGVITDIVVKTKAQTMMQFPEDVSNNASSATPKQAIENKNE